MTALLAAVAAAAAIGLAVPRRPRLAPLVALREERHPDPGLLHRWRVVWSVLAAVGGWSFVEGSAGVVAGVAAGLGAWWAIARSEPVGVRRTRRLAERDLPHLVLLLGAALRAGAAPSGAVAAVVSALPGPAADRLTRVRAGLDLGLDPVAVWTGLADDPVLAPLGRCLARASRSGAGVADAVEALAVDLAARAGADLEDRARTVGVQAAVPLGLCLLPAFLLIGVVPVVVGLFGTLLT